MMRSINFVLAEKNGQKEKRKIGRASLKYMSKNKTLTSNEKQHKFANNLEILTAFKMYCIILMAPIDFVTIS